MAVSLSFILTLPLLFLLFISASSTIAVENKASVDNFLQCFQVVTWFSVGHILHAPDDLLYESILQSTARNGRPLSEKTSLKPSLIATPDEEWHVCVIAKCAYAYDLQIRTRSGGHDYEGMSFVSTEDGEKYPFILVDLAFLNNVEVDTMNSTAWVQAGATLGELYYHVFNKTGGTGGFPAGIYPTVGVGGHLSVGGMGTMMRKYGVAADNVVDARIVVREGVLLDRRLMGEEVFWALRGGGGQSWGIVLSFKIRVVAVPRRVATFTVKRNISTSRPNGAVHLTRWQEIAPKSKIDENLFIQATLVVTSAHSGATIQLELQSLFLGSCNRLVQILSTTYPELNITRHDCNRMTWLESVLFFSGLPLNGKGIEALLDRPLATPSSFFCKSKSDFVTTPITLPQWVNILKSITSLNTSFSMQLLPMGTGKMSEISESAIPFPHRRGNLYNIQYLTVWRSSAGSETTRRMEFMRRLYEVMTPYVSSSPRASYYGVKDYDLGRNEEVFPSYEEARTSWGEKYFKRNFERLSRVKRVVDAGNYFRNEQSIPPFHSWVINNENEQADNNSTSSSSSSSFFAEGQQEQVVRV